MRVLATAGRSTTGLFPCCCSYDHKTLILSSLPAACSCRLATELEKLDGNRAVRLMLHTLELLEGASPEQVRASCAAFDAVIANRPPYVQTMRNLFQFASMLARGAALHALHGVVLPRLRRLLGVPTAAADAARPVTPRGFYSYYSAPNPAPANFQCFVSPGRNTFRPFMDFFESWRVASGRVGVVYIINLPVNPGPGPVVEGFVPTAHDALDIVKRYRGVRSPSGAPPPPGEAWVFKNPTMVQELFMNNYGSHKCAGPPLAPPPPAAAAAVPLYACSGPLPMIASHSLFDRDDPSLAFCCATAPHRHSFRSKPTAHKWDWIGIAAPIAGAGAITINGTSLFWLRGTRGELDEQAKRLAPLLGAPVASVDQICNWPRSKGA